MSVTGASPPPCDSGLQRVIAAWNSRHELRLQGRARDDEPAAAPAASAAGEAVDVAPQVVEHRLGVRLRRARRRRGASRWTRPRRS